MGRHSKNSCLGLLFLLAVVMAFLSGRTAGHIQAEHHWHLYCQSLGDIHARTLNKMHIQMENRIVDEGLQSDLSPTGVVDELTRLNADIRLLVFGMEYFLDNQDASREAFIAEASAIRNDIMLDYRKQTRIFKIGKYRGDY